MSPRQTRKEPQRSPDERAGFLLASAARHATSLVPWVVFISPLSGVLPTPSHPQMSPKPAPNRRPYLAPIRSPSSSKPPPNEPQTSPKPTSLSRPYQDSFQLLGMAEAGLAPKCFAVRHPRFGTPVRAIAVQLLMIGILVGVDFESKPRPRVHSHRPQTPHVDRPHKDTTRRPHT